MPGFGRERLPSRSFRGADVCLLCEYTALDREKPVGSGDPAHDFEGKIQIILRSVASRLISV